MTLCHVLRFNRRKTTTKQPRLTYLNFDLPLRHLTTPSRIPWESSLKPHKDCDKPNKYRRETNELWVTISQVCHVFAGLLPIRKETPWKVTWNIDAPAGSSLRRKAPIYSEEKISVGSGQTRAFCSYIEWTAKLGVGSVICSAIPAESPQDFSGVILIRVTTIIIQIRRNLI